MQKFSEVLSYLYTNLSVYQNQGASALHYKLDKILAMCEELENPQQSFPSIHVAGTNGKGSTSHYIAAALQLNGYSVGLYTSPHLKSFTERIRVNGKEVTEQYVIDFVNQINPLVKRYKPSFFEVTVLMAFDYFRKSKIDISVIEVGLGGRYDSTNIINPLISVITNIGLDHQCILGDTLEQIAKEKAGIIKQGVPVVIGERQQELVTIFKEIAIKNNAPICWAEDVGYMPLSDNVYLKKNQKTAYATLKGIRKYIDLDLSLANESFENVSLLTGLKGRWQVLGERPMMVCDTGHNVDGIAAILKQIAKYKYKKLIAVLGFVSDKDIKHILNLLPKTAYYIFCQANIPRAMDVSFLYKKALAQGLKGEVVKEVSEAIAQAKKIAEVNDFIWIGGSTFVVAEIEDL